MQGTGNSAEQQKDGSTVLQTAPAGQHTPAPQATGNAGSVHG
jgi:hypothetical protein